MLQVILRSAVFVALAFGVAATRADELGTEIDLTTFGEAAREPASVWDGIPLEEVGR